ncbi:MAG TPA: glycosyltransferase family A protein [Candidatus Bathyarchaeia archaeon]|nr:glycosyltransferase family A protein [Candidatus Bathyarchaeia archaeon]
MENSTYIRRKPAISVIIPCFNHGEFLDETVESVLSQTFKNYEIIVIDDGSTDAGTLHALDRLEKRYPQIKIIRQSNGGPSNARNNGIKISRGEYILPLDSDDIIEPRMLEKCHATLSKNPKLGFVYTYTHYFGAEDFVWKNPEYNFFDLLSSNQTTVSALTRKKAWEEVGGFDEDERNGYEDWEFWINLGDHGWFGMLIREPLFNYRKAGKSRMGTTELKYQKAVGYIREKHRHLYSKESLEKIKKEWKSGKGDNILMNLVAKLEGAGLYDQALWKRHPIAAFGRLVPVRVKRKINSLFGKRIFDTSYYHRS